ncbi:hypothetical protein [Mariniluteicoccus endophyticus]
MTQDPRPATEEAQHASGDLDHAEDAPAPGEPMPTADLPAIDESLPFDAAEEAEDRWWETDDPGSAADGDPAGAARLS